MTQANFIKQLPTLDLYNIFADQRWVYVDLAVERERGFYPNRMHFNASYQQAAVTVERCQARPEFNLIEAAYSYLIKAVDSGRVKDAHVVLKERGIWRVVAHARVKSVGTNLLGHAPHDSRCGPYWALDPTFRVVKPEMPF